MNMSRAELNTLISRSSIENTPPPAKQATSKSRKSFLGGLFSIAKTEAKSKKSHFLKKEPKSKDRPKPKT